MLWGFATNSFFHEATLVGAGLAVDTLLPVHIARGFAR